MLTASDSQFIPAAKDWAEVNCLAHSEGHRKGLNLLQDHKMLEGLQNADFYKLWGGAYSS